MVAAATAYGYHKDREFLNAPSSLSLLERTCRAFSKESNSRYPSSSFLSTSKSYSSRISTISSSSSPPSSSSTSQRLPSQLLNPLPKTLSALSQNRSHSIDSVRASPRTTARSLSVSFQGESFVFHTIKAKPTPRKPSTGPIYEGDGRFLKVRASDSNLLTKRSDPISLTVRLLLDEENFSIGDRSPPLDSDLLKGRVKSPSQTLPSRKLVPCSLSGPKSYFPRQDGVPRTNINSPENHSNDQAGNAPSIISFASEVRRRKKSESRIEDAHKLRMFHNRYLQWRYTNAIMESAFSTLMVNAKSNLYKVWATISGLYKLSMNKKVELEALMQNLKLASMLKEQVQV